LQYAPFYSVVPNGFSNSTQDSQATIFQTRTQAQSQSQLTLTGNNHRRNQPGILLATQDKYIVKRKHAFELESPFLGEGVGFEGFIYKTIVTQKLKFQSVAFKFCI
jgi:hypothetical protein